MVREYLNKLANLITNDASKYGDNMYIPSFLKHLFGSYNILSRGASGQTLTLDFQSIKNVFLVKIPLNNAIKYQETFHESVIASYLNTLRSQTSGFMYGFGGFYCGFDNKNNQIQLCTPNKNTISFISLFEYIEGNSLVKMIKMDQLSNIEILNIIRLIVNQLRIAYRKYNFVHNDLHAGNVMIRKLNKVKTYILQGINKTYTVESQYEPVLIDYGYSTIRVNQKLIRKFEYDIEYVFKENNIFLVNEELPLWDLYRLTLDIFSQNTERFHRMLKPDIFLFPYFWKKAKEINSEIEIKVKKDVLDRFYNTTSSDDFDGPWPYFIYEKNWYIPWLQNGSCEDFQDYLATIHIST